MTVVRESLEQAWRPDRPLRDSLAAWLPTQRWFAGKGHVIAAVDVAEVAWLPSADPSADACVVVDVTFADERPHRYALWLGVREDGAAAPVGRSQLGERRWIVDVASSPAGILALLSSAAACPAVGGGTLVASDRDAAAARTLATAPAVRTLGADQSNTSVRVGDDLVLKLFRRIQPGENPELEMLRFLSTRTAFTEMAAPRGALSLVDATGAVHTVALLQDWVANDGDGWRYVVSRLETHLAAPGGWPSWRQDMAALGGSTARFHRASAADAGDPAFGIKPLSAPDIATWSAGLAHRAAVVLDLRPGAHLPPGDARRLDAALHAVASGVGTFTGPATGGPLLGIRIHGDYHLGQTLKTPGGFILIDFEGEPARPLEERRCRHHALKDVAGMIRSFEYAMAVAAGQNADAMARLRHELPLESAFLDAYLEDIAGSGLVPEDGPARTAWQRFFVLEKAVYELEYELNNRPDWASIPARAIARLLDA